MATPIVAEILSSIYDQAPAPFSARVAITAAGLEFRVTGKDYLHLSSVAGDTVTIVSTDDTFGRTGDIAVVLAAGEEVVWGPSKQNGFIDASGNLVITAPGDATAVLFRTK